MSDDILRQLAAKAGIAPQWTDQSGAERDVAPDSLRAILAALGLPADGDAALRNSLSMLESGVNAAATSRFTTARVGQPVSLPLSAPGGTPMSVGSGILFGSRRITHRIRPRVESWFTR